MGGVKVDVQRVLLLHCKRLRVLRRRTEVLGGEIGRVGQGIGRVIGEEGGIGRDGDRRVQRDLQLGGWRGLRVVNVWGVEGRVVVGWRILWGGIRVVELPFRVRVGGVLLRIALFRRVGVSDRRRNGKGMLVRVMSLVIVDVGSEVGLHRCGDLGGWLG